jgi:hypothetical protein
MLLAIFLAWLCWPSSRLTFENVARVHAGQNYHEVIDILGKPDDGPWSEVVHLLDWGSMGKFTGRWGLKPGTPGPLTMPIVDVTFTNGVVSDIRTSNIKP